MIGVAGTVAIFQEHLLLPTTVQGAIWPFNPRYWRPAHYHAQVEFLLVRRGHATERVGRAIHTVFSGQLIWHLPGIEHELLHASSDCDFIVVQAEPDLCAAVGRGAHSRVPYTTSDPLPSFSSWVRELGRLTSGRPVVELKRADQDLLLEACSVTCASDSLRPEQSALRLHSALDHAWRATLADHDDRRPNSLVELACCLVLEDPALDRRDVCRVLDVSESYLTRRFQLELGLTFVEQRARSRLARFSTHVARDSRSYLESALDAGFGSYSQLHRVFVQLVGVSPREYFARGGRNERARV
jgi:AraC-like DNA-binding protein/quercetin dioxygenase-like cupin family protein